MPLKNLICVVLSISALAWTQTMVSHSPPTKPSHSGVAPCAYSLLWGVGGEKWIPEARLPDFSYAGYHAGEAKIPTPPVTWDLKRDFHAAGNGRTDDSQALLN